MQAVSSSTHIAPNPSSTISTAPSSSDFRLSQIRASIEQSDEMLMGLCNDIVQYNRTGNNSDVAGLFARAHIGLWWDRELETNKHNEIMRQKEIRRILCYFTLEFASREETLAVVQRHGRLLRYTKKEFREDKEIVLAAAKEDSSAIGFASLQLQQDPDVLAARKQKPEEVEASREEKKWYEECLLEAKAKRTNNKEELKFDLVQFLALSSQEC